MQKNIAIFASGGGSNAAEIMKYFQNHAHIHVSLVVTNNAHAGVIEKATNFNVPIFVSESQSVNPSELMKELDKRKIEFIILAGYLKKIPEILIQKYNNKIINIHPSLLPKFGGKGMYGMHVHKAVVNAKEKVTGMTIHFVNEHYDEGKIIEQHQVILSGNESPEEVQKMVLKLEHAYFAPCIEKVIGNGI